MTAGAGPGDRSDRLGRHTGSAVLWQAARLGGTKLIFLVRTLVLALLLVPDDFGLLAISLVAVDLLMSLTNFGMVPALVQRPEADRREYDVAWTIAVIRAVGVAAAAALAAPLVASLFAEPRATPLIAVIALRPVLEAGSSIKLAALIRALRFRSLALLDLADALVHTGVAIALAEPAGVWALVYGSLAGRAVYVILSYGFAPHRPRLALDAVAARPLIEFGRWIFVVGVIAVAGRFALQGVISRRLGAAELGLYFLAAKLAFLPSQVAGELVSAIAFPLFVQLREDLRAAARAFRSILVGVFALVGPLCALLVAVAPSLASDLLGARWEGTGPLIQVLAVSTVVGLLGDMTVPFLHGMGEPSKHVALELIQTSALILLVFVLTAQLGVLGAALAWIPAVALSQVLAAVYVHRAMPGLFRDLRVPLGVVALVSLAAGALAWGLHRAIPDVTGLVAALLVAGTAAAAALWALDRRLNLGFAADFARLFPQIATRLGFLRAEG